MVSQMPWMITHTTFVQKQPWWVSIAYHLRDLEESFWLVLLVWTLLLPAMAVASNWCFHWQVFPPLQVACRMRFQMRLTRYEEAFLFQGSNWIFSFNVAMHMKFFSQTLGLAVTEVWQESRESQQPIPVQAMNEATVDACTLEKTSTQAFYPTCHPWSGYVCVKTHCLDCGTLFLAILFH